MDSAHGLLKALDWAYPLWESATINWDWICHERLLTSAWRDDVTAYTCYTSWSCTLKIVRPYRIWLHWGFTEYQRTSHEEGWKLNGINSKVVWMPARQTFRCSTMNYSVPVKVQVFLHRLVSWHINFISIADHHCPCSGKGRQGRLKICVLISTPDVVLVALISWITDLNQDLEIPAFCLPVPREKGLLIWLL